jgi:cyanophycin synthetase
MTPLLQTRVRRTAGDPVRSVCVCYERSLVKIRAGPWLQFHTEWMDVVITILESSVYRGPSIWAREPALRLQVDLGDGEGRPTNTLPGFVDRLLTDIPSLEDHRCTLGRRGGFVERMREGTPLSHVLEHVALEVQRLAGANISKSKTRSTGTPGIYNVIVAYRQERVGQAAADLATRFLNHLACGAEPDFDVRHELEQVILLAERLAYGPSTLAIVEEAERRDIPVLRLHPTKSLVQLGHGRYQRRIWRGSNPSSRPRSLPTAPAC